MKYPSTTLIKELSYNSVVKRITAIADRIYIKSEYIHFYIDE